MKCFEINQQIQECEKKIAQLKDERSDLEARKKEIWPVGQDKLKEALNKHEDYGFYKTAKEKLQNFKKEFQGLYRREWYDRDGDWDFEVFCSGEVESHLGKVTQTLNKMKEEIEAFQNSIYTELKSKYVDPLIGPYDKAIATRNMAIRGLSGDIARLKECFETAEDLQISVSAIEEVLPNLAKLGVYPAKNGITVTADDQGNPKFELYSEESTSIEVDPEDCMTDEELLETEEFCQARYAAESTADAIYEELEDRFPDCNIEIDVDYEPELDGCTYERHGTGLDWDDGSYDPSGDFYEGEVSYGGEATYTITIEKEEK